MEQKFPPINLEDRLSIELKEEFSHIPKAVHGFKEEEYPELRKGVDHVLSSLAKYPVDNLTVSSRHIPGPEGAPEVYVKIYKPKDSDSSKMPGLLWMHGGGMLFGHADFCAYWAPCLADQANCVAVVVDYRLAPEYPYPAGLEDSYAALVWMVQAAEELGIDPDRIAVGGESSGGNLTAALCMLARDKKGPKICFQMPLYPMLDDRNDTPSSYGIVDERTWNRDINMTAWALYLKNNKDQETPIYAAPARAQDLSNLPPAFTFVGDLDGFRDETMSFSQRLMQAGVPVEFHVYPGCTHGFEVFFAEKEVSKRAVSLGVYALKQAFAVSKKDSSLMFLHESFS